MSPKESGRDSSALNRKSRSPGTTSLSIVSGRLFSELRRVTREGAAAVVAFEKLKKSPRGRCLEAVRRDLLHTQEINREAHEDAKAVCDDMLEWRHPVQLHRRAVGGAGDAPLS